jgi:acyl carrier protein
MLFQPQLVEKGAAMLESNEIDARIAKVLVEALGVEDAEIKPSATLQRDLGAESIDFLDIIFRLERDFAIKIHQNELFPDKVILGNSALIDDGELTDDGLAALRMYLPYANWTKVEQDRRLEGIDDLFTVELMASYIRWKLDGNGATATDAHAQARRHSHEALTLRASSTAS